MCYDDQARPPAPPGTAGAAQGQEIILTAKDSTRFEGYAAFPAQHSHTGVLIYPDVRGLHQFYKELALRFAEMGINALAIDYFGRTAGISSRAEPFEYMPHVQQMKYDTFLQDVQAGVAYLREKHCERIFAVGFCRGGTLVLLTGTEPSLGFTGLIPFYAGLSRGMEGKGTPLENSTHVAYPVLGLFGGADQGIPESDRQQLDEQLDMAGVEHKIVVYPDAPHSFFDRRSAEFADASADAWQRITDFIAMHKETHSH